MFHVNSPTEVGLVAATKVLLANPPAAPIEYDAPLGIRIGPTNFLRLHTSTTEWMSFKQIAEHAEQIDSLIYKSSLHAILCDMYKRGEFEKKIENDVMFYRRLLERAPKRGKVIRLRTRNA